MTRKANSGYQPVDFPTLASKVQGFQAIVERGVSFDRGDMHLVPAMQDALVAKSGAEWAEYYTGLTDSQKGMFMMIASGVLDPNSLRNIVEGLFHTMVEIEVKAKARRILDRELEAVGERHVEADMKILLAARTMDEAQRLRDQVGDQTEKVDDLKRRIASMNECWRTEKERRYAAERMAAEFERKYDELQGALAIVGKALGVTA